MPAGKRILLGISGSIAAYKSILLLRLLVKSGAEVKVMMTPSAKAFVSPLVLATLSKQPVVIELSENDQWENHVALGRWADLMIMAPLSCNTLAKMAHGICDNLFMAVYLSATCPVMIAPAMDEDMWKHPATQENLQKILARGHQLIPVTHGFLASGLTGEGRMAEPEDILASIQLHFDKRNDFAGKNILITSGATHEAIDPVRYIGNHASGKMGNALAASFAARGASVTLITGPATAALPEGMHQTIQVQSAQAMYEAVMQEAKHADVLMMAAAVADYTPANVSPQKIKKQSEELTLVLHRTKDILKTLGVQKSPHQLLIGFALETENGKEYALKKLADKNADAIVLNMWEEGKTGFGADTNRVSIYEKNGTEHHFELKTKKETAEDIVNTVKKMLDA
ncbi:MAG: bifunctional phosphopantothenoylcysteine decarboxylase/phosphopantothenate--cysteine ligase CoaBC [Bacteroidetes bacterium]|nr:bifunctional phosphopantothenoylcysteine decarboxylase/phosphopantothenate--cysteine ligase CoaBC [Bacteroidota bacterium]